MYTMSLSKVTNGVSESNHLLLSCSIAPSRSAKTTSAMAIVDSGTISNFIGKDFIRSYHIPLYCLSKEY